MVDLPFTPKYDCTLQPIRAKLQSVSWHQNHIVVRINNAALRSPNINGAYSVDLTFINGTIKAIPKITLPVKIKDFEFKALGSRGFEFLALPDQFHINEVISPQTLSGGEQSAMFYLPDDQLLLVSGQEVQITFVCK